MKISRRHFIQSSTIAGLYYALPLQAQTNLGVVDQDQFLVQILVPGGMDVSLSLDPYIHSKYNTDQNDIFIEYRPDQILGSSSLKFGPACETLLPFINECVVINGIVMKRDVGHESLLNYIAAGSFDSAHLALESGHHLGKTNLGVLSAGQTQMGGRKVTVTPIQNLKELDRSISDLSYLDPSNSNMFGPHLNQIENLLDFNKNLTLLNESIKKARSDLQTDNVEIPIIIGSFLEGFSKSVILNLESVELDLELDTHSNHEATHLEAQTNAWNYIADIFQSFKQTEYKQGSLFDRTTFVVMSEFSRTPFLNGARGKDHNVFTNSVLIAGGKVKGNKSIGESKVIARGQNPTGQAIHIGKAFDFDLGQSVNDQGQNVGLIFPENVGKSFQTLFSDVDTFYPNLSTTKPIKGIFK